MVVPVADGCTLVCPSRPAPGRCLDAGDADRGLDRVQHGFCQLVQRHQSGLGDRLYRRSRQTIPSSGAICLVCHDINHVFCGPAFVCINSRHRDDCPLPTGICRFPRWWGSRLEDVEKIARMSGRFVAADVSSRSSEGVCADGCRRLLRFSSLQCSGLRKTLLISMRFEFHE